MRAAAANVILMPGFQGLLAADAIAPASTGVAIAAFAGIGNYIITEVYSNFLRPAEFEYVEFWLAIASNGDPADFKLQANDELDITGWEDIPGKAAATILADITHRFVIIRVRQSELAEGKALVRAALHPHDGLTHAAIVGVGVNPIGATPAEIQVAQVIEVVD